MGLFDKIKGSVNSAVGSDPLSDPIVKKYFEIICGMRATFLSTEAEEVSNNEKAKKYIEYFLESSCDEEKLEKALSLYNMSRSDYPNNKTELILSNFRKSLSESTTYRLNRYYATMLFCREEVTMALIDFNHILDVIEENVNYKHFSQGMEKLQYNRAIKNIVITESFCGGRSATQKLVLEYLEDSFIGRIKSEKYNTLYDIRSDIAQVTLRALNFEKQNGNSEGYKSISEEDYRNFVLSVPYYSRVIEDNPFDKEKYINAFSERVKSGKIFYSLYSSYTNGFHIEAIHDYFCDFACYLLWKEITENDNWINEDGEDISESKNPRDVFNILCYYFENSD